jgi:hypothetical protein
MIILTFDNRIINLSDCEMVTADEVQPGERPPNNEKWRLVAGPRGHAHHGRVYPIGFYRTKEDAETAACELFIHWGQVDASIKVSDLIGKAQETQEDLGDLDDDALKDLLCLVDVDVPLEVVRGWSPLDRALVEEWASAVHLSASDNDDVKVPAMPQCVKDFA